MAATISSTFPPLPGNAPLFFVFLSYFIYLREMYIYTYLLSTGKKVDKIPTRPPLPLQLAFSQPTYLFNFFSFAICAALCPCHITSSTHIIWFFISPHKPNCLETPRRPFDALVTAHHHSLVVFNSHIIFFFFFSRLPAEHSQSKTTTEMGFVFLLFLSLFVSFSGTFSFLCWISNFGWFLWVF